MSSGDILIGIADGNWMNCDVPSPIASNITFQSSRLSSLSPLGYRVFPFNGTSYDLSNAANLAKCQYASGIVFHSEAHGSGTLLAGDGACNLTWSSDTFTMPAYPAQGGCGLAGLANVANNTQVEIEIAIQGNLDNASSELPSGLQSAGGPGTKFYIKNCSTSPACGSPGMTFQLSAAPGGTAITGSTCTGTCIPATFQITVPLQVTANSSAITVLDSAFSTWTVGTTLYFSACGFMSCPTTANPENFALPPPLAQDTAYCIKTLSGNQISVAATCGGTAITLTSVGVGPLLASSPNLANNWTFSGIEHTEISGMFISGGFIQIGSSFDASTLGMVNGIEIDRNYFHALAGDTSPPVRAIVNNAKNVTMRDSYISGMMAGEAQGILSLCSPGPTLYQNNFVEGLGENFLSGGGQCSSGIANANQSIFYNYAYKPPMLKITTGTFVPVGFCWYDVTDPNFPGGEYYENTSTSTWYQCNSSHAWAVGAAPANLGGPVIKTVFESKNLRNVTYLGNIANYNWSAGNTNAAQQGQCFNNSQEAGSGPGMANDHITMNNNACFNVYTPLNRISECGNGTLIQCVPAYTASNHSLVNDLFVISPYACNVYGSGAQTNCAYHSFFSTWSSILGNTPGLLVSDLMNHVSVFSPDSPSYTSAVTPWYGNITGSCGSQGAVPGATWENSILTGDFLGDCYVAGTEIANYFATSAFASIALKGASGTYLSTEGTNTLSGFVFPATNTGIGWVNGDGTPTGDYHLDPTSNYSASNPSATQLSTDGTDLGADIDQILAATSGAVAGTPTWAVQMGFTLTPTATGAVATYTRPGTTACSMTLYNAAPRITGNVNADTSTSGQKLDTRTGNTVVGENVTFNLGFNTPLTPSTQYWYSLSCVATGGATWKLAGINDYTFTTLASSASGGTVTSGNVTTSGNVVRQ